MIDKKDRLLLFRRQPSNIWITPGGGVKPGESYEQAALRELWEETGLEGVKLEPWVWTRPDVFHRGKQRYEGFERFFLVRTREFAVLSANMNPIEAASMREHRWWSVDEIDRASGRETFAPKRLAELLQPIIGGEIPPRPINTGP